MSYKWKPSASQRRAFAERMKDPSEQAAYDARKAAKAEKRRSSSKFDYNTAGGSYVPTKEQHDFCMWNWPADLTNEQNAARDMVLMGYSCGQKVHHDYIHIVNELRRNNH